MNRRQSLQLLIAGSIAAGMAPRMAGAQAPSRLEDIKKRGTLRVGWAVWLPYLYRDPSTREIVGVAIDIYKAMADDLKVKLELVEDNWSTLIAGLQANKFDLTALMAITAERQKAVWFSEPIVKEPTDIVVRREDLAKYKAWADLDQPGKTVTTTMGSNTQFSAQKNFKNAEVVLVKAGPDSVNQLLTKRVEGWVAVHSAAAYALKEYPQLAVAPALGLPAEPIAFPVRPGDDALRAWLNGFIAKQVSSGDLLRTLQKYGLDSGSLPS